MNPAALRSLLWSRPRSRAEWGFTLFLAIMAVAALAWLATHAGSEDWRALRNWVAVLRGDTTLKLRTPAYLQGGLMLAACAWIAIPIALCLTRSWWMILPDIQRRDDALFDRRFGIALALILVLAAALRVPRLGLSLYNDEVDVFRTAIGGSFDSAVLNDLASPEPAPFKQVSWPETIWGNRIGNNHVLHSILARIGFDAWRAASGAVPGEIREWPLRLPPLLGGLGSIVALAALARRLTGSAAAGGMAAFLLAIHPWHLRYSTEARGYGLIFAFASLACLFLVLALDRNRWRWWLAFGASQLLCLWSFLGSLHLILGLNLVFAVLCLWPRRGPAGARSNPLRSPLLPGWIVANVLSGGIFLLLAAPILPPIQMALKLNTTFQQGASPDWWPDVAGFLLLGMPWFDGDPSNPVNPAILKDPANPFPWIALALALPAIATGVGRLWREGTAGRLLVLAPAFGLVVPWVESALSGKILLKWYVNYETLFVALAMAAGIDAWLRRLAPRLGPVRLRFAAYALLGLYAAGVAKPLAIYRRHGKQALRDAIELVRGGAFPFEPAQTVPLVGGWWTHANYYDPSFKIAHTPENLEILVRRARAEGRPLYFILGMRDRARSEDARVVDRLERSGDFSTLAILPGLEESQFRTYVYRLQEAPGRP